MDVRMESGVWGVRSVNFREVMLSLCLLLLFGCQGADNHAEDPNAKTTGLRTVRVDITAATSEFALGTTLQLSATAILEDDSTEDVTETATWSSRDPEIVSVDEHGIVSAVAAGRATVNATVPGIRSSFILTVLSSPTQPTPLLTSIAITYTGENPFTLGAKVQFAATANFSDGSSEDISTTASWSSTDPLIATVAPAGLVEMLSPGNVTIIAEKGGVTGQATVTVLSPPPVLTAIAVSHSAATLHVGDQVAFTATGTYADASTAVITDRVTWSSSDMTIATVDATGLVTLLAPGSVTLMAQSGTITGELAVTVISAVTTLTSVTINDSGATMRAGLAVQFGATGTYSDASTADLTQQVAWSSSDTGVAIVDTTGLVTLVSAGGAIISAQLGDVTGTLTITVLAANVTLKSIDVIHAGSVLYAGKQEQFTAQALYSDASTADITALVTWHSTVATVATVAANGQVSYLAPGTTTISAVLDTVTGAQDITVTADSVTALTISAPVSTIDHPGTLQAKATADYASGDKLDVSATATWTSGDTGIATVSSTGLITSVAPGPVTISAALGGIADTLDVTINATVNVVSFQIDAANQYTLQANDSAQYSATAVYDDTSVGDITADVTWESSLPAVAGVDTNGVVTANSLGAAIISATYHGAVSRTVVTIAEPMTLTVAGRTPTALGLTWKAVAQANTYSVYWSTSAGVGTRDNVVADLTLNQLNAFPLTADTDYFLRLRAVTDGVASDLGPELHIAAGTMSNNSARLTNVTVGSNIDDTNQLRKIAQVTDNAGHADIAFSPAYITRYASQVELLKLILPVRNTSATTTYCDIQVVGSYRDSANQRVGTINVPLVGTILKTAGAYNLSCLLPGQNGFVLGSLSRSTAYSNTSTVRIDQVTATNATTVSIPGIQFQTVSLTEPVADQFELQVLNSGSNPGDLNSLRGSVNSTFLLLDTDGSPLFWGYLAPPPDAVLSFIGSAGNTANLIFSTGYQGQASGVQFIFDIDPLPSTALVPAP